MPNRKLHRVGQSRAFTLVEMLVVIAVFAILAALLFSSAQVAKRSAANAKCVHNLRQLAQLSNMWSLDHEGFCPQGWWWTPFGELPQNYLDASNLTKYGLTSELSTCPSSGFKTLSYGINVALVVSPSEIWGPGDRWFWDHGRVKMFQLSAKTILFAETPSTNGWAVGPGEGAYLARWDSIAGPHGKKSNIVYGDGHVGSEAVSELEKKEPWEQGLPDGM